MELSPRLRWVWPRPAHYSLLFVPTYTTHMYHLPFLPLFILLLHSHSPSSSPPPPPPLPLPLLLSPSSSHSHSPPPPLTLLLLLSPSPSSSPPPPPPLPLLLSLSFSPSSSHPPPSPLTLPLLSPLQVLSEGGGDETLVEGLDQSLTPRGREPPSGDHKSPTGQQEDIDEVKSRRQWLHEWV